MRNYIVYHHPCSDGYTAAAAAFAKFGWSHGTAYVKLSLERPTYLQHLEDSCEEDTIYFVDCCPKVDDIKFLKGNIVILDHHKTNKEDFEQILEMRPEITGVFDMERSGAGIAWDYFHKGKTRPLIVDLVEDRDLWRFKYNDSKAFFYGTDIQNETLESYTNLFYNPERVKEIIKRGKAVVEYIDSKIFLACTHNIKIIPFHGIRAIFINATENVSDVGNKALELYPQADITIVYQHYPTTNEVKLSLRSRRSENIDVSELCKTYGGGGHKNASGCVVTMETFRNMVVK